MFEHFQVLSRWLGISDKNAFDPSVNPDESGAETIEIDAAENGEALGTPQWFCADLRLFSTLGHSFPTFPRFRITRENGQHLGTVQLEEQHH